MSFSLLGLICLSSHVRMYQHSLTKKTSIFSTFFLCKTQMSLCSFLLQGLKPPFSFAHFLFYLLPNCVFFKHLITWRQMKQSMRLKHHCIISLTSDSFFIDSVQNLGLLGLLSFFLRQHFLIQICLKGRQDLVSQDFLLKSKSQAVLHVCFVEKAVLVKMSKINIYKSSYKSCSTQMYWLKNTVDTADALISKFWMITGP